MGFPLKQNASGVSRIGGKGKDFRRFAGMDGGFGRTARFDTLIG